MTVLIGPNNAGKTNILSALNLLIGERRPMPGNLADADFYQGDRTRPIYIRLDFKDAPYGRLEFDTGAAQYNLKAYDHAGNQVRGFNNDNRAQLAFAYVDAARSFDRQFSYRSSVLKTRLKRDAGQSGPPARERSPKLRFAYGATCCHRFKPQNHVAWVTTGSASSVSFIGSAATGLNGSS
jgi:hypothetical protein